MPVWNYFFFLADLPCADLFSIVKHVAMQLLSSGSLLDVCVTLQHHMTSYNIPYD